MMTTPTTGRKPRRLAGQTNPDLARLRAVAAVMLGAPPPAIAADLGCDVATLMGWVKAQRLMLQRAARPAAAPEARDDTDDAERAEAAPARAVGPVGAKRSLGADRQVAPENSALVDAAYRRAQFDYSGRRVRPVVVTH